VSSQGSDWYWEVYGAGLAHRVPRMSGVYIIACVERHCGLPLHLNPLYAGQAKDLRRRWNQHVDLSEPNPGLFLIDRRSDLEFWWRLVPEVQLNAVESDLIRCLHPTANRRGKAS
jgi:excinuclease UvrABC nuclease subunit